MTNQVSATSAPYAAVAAIEFALKDEDGLIFLQLWHEGDFDAIRAEWENVPDKVFIGADPLFQPTVEVPEHATAYPQVRMVLAHKHTCANVQPGSTSMNACDCGAMADGKPVEVERGSTHGFEQSPNTCRHLARSGVWWREGSITRTGRECNACGSVDEDPATGAALDSKATEGASHE
ncbi:hypothetical protein A1395_06220 [Pseudomonas protegens]|uniref:hypothetical protein n=1 Tax=Pseudomonas protegens TaxID=380021 RepID=UPI000C9AAD50|nr:hypothetical protein [Pseudomonas protegens]PNG40238.1 hypothetical protein A1395_06220 [Pseudomonas protegens]